MELKKYFKYWIIGSKKIQYYYKLKNNLLLKYEIIIIFKNIYLKIDIFN
jgi:hypothetical protein